MPERVQVMNTNEHQMAPDQFAMVYGAATLCKLSIDEFAVRSTDNRARARKCELELVTVNPYIYTPDGRVK